MTGATRARRLLVYGAGGLGREILQAIRDARATGVDVDCAGFVVDPAFDPPESVHGLPVYRAPEEVLKDEHAAIVIAVGDTAQRAKLAARLTAEIGARFATVIHPRACLGETVHIGEGSMVLAFASVTSDVMLGRHVLINPGVTIAHDCSVGDFVSVGPSVALAGGVRIGAGCDLGVAASFAPRAAVGCWSVVGAGAAVLKQHPANVVIAGVPARIIKTLADDWQSA